MDEGMNITRRTFIKSGAVVALVALVPPPVFALIKQEHFLQDNKLYCFSCWATSPITVVLGPGTIDPGGHRIWNFDPPLWVESMPEKKCGKWWFSRVIGSGKDLKTLTFKLNHLNADEEVQFYGGVLEEELGENLAIFVKTPRNKFVATL